ncbi:putative helix-loop-helix dna-binding domain-containing protein [Phaeoacremonium minimum UCRPA7]|uniref:Putative helix-loop-helix dna-binding domain-containing protein n=1 Tax=Phaeoacremonium minimum (strain UCR-PA7) TaxID=1286976 RepID=R8BR17_PHAM7|nr:putative helix-loop-helix dna-binding domain-containing protein [Phaeoacremonium minimum UCRPA7]EOO01818.1 putative helix-loop-helix dna-binding domain-containing protein [Phaeoacremonium minimum UCRPA7]
MDPNFLRHIDYFSVPNNQTNNRTGSSTTPAQTSNLWDTTTLNPDPPTTESPSTAPTTLSLDSFAQPSTAPSSLSFNKNSARQSYNGLGSRTILPTRTPKPRENRDRKRTKLSTDATPFDNVDYWIQFDEQQEAGQDNEMSNSNKGKERAVQGQRSTNTTQSMDFAGISGRSIRPEDMIDDSALDNALSDDEDFSSMNLADQLSKIESAPPSEVPQREGLYSTPLSWEKPQPGLRMDSLIGLASPSLNDEEQRRLIAIAMNPGSSMGGLGSSNLGASFGSGFGPTLGSGLNFGMGMGMGMGNMPNFTNMGQVTNDAPLLRPESLSRGEPPAKMQRTSTSASDKGKETMKPPPMGDRTAHNDIERKYRTNLKDKIAELRDAVPALSTIPEGGVDDGDDDSSQPTRGPKVSKGTVLTKATEYIHYLEKKNKAIMQQHNELSRRLQAFEQLLNATARPTFQMPNYSTTLFDPRGFC